MSKLPGGMQLAVRMTVLLISCTSMSFYAAAQATPGPKAAEMAVQSPVLYDVATIKLNKTLSGDMSFGMHANSYNVTNASLKNLLENAYDIRQELISGLPGWAEAAHYDIVAKATDADPETLKKLTDDQQRAMLRQMLEERFHIKAHIEVKTLPTFDLVLAKDGARFKSFVATEGQPEGEMNMNWQNGNMKMTAYGVPMSTLTYMLSNTVKRTVTDKTGMAGKYVFTLKWLSDDAPAGGDDAAPPIFTALQEQLGLKLVPSKGPVETLVIDSISQPSEN